MEPTSVYQYFNERGHLLYVGVTGRGHKRLEEHVKSKPWWPEVFGCTVEHQRDRATALGREKELIQKHRPMYNIVHNHGSAPSDHERRVGRPGIKERRRAWYEASADARQHMMCVECDRQPGVGGPTCPTCFAAKRARKQKYIRSLS